MVLMTWNANFVTGIDIVDRQHQHLLELVNESAPILALSFRQNPERSSQLLDGLLAYAAYHFKTEDDLMQQQGIDQRHLQHHLQAHAEFARKIAEMRQMYEHGNSVTGGEVLSFLANWLVFHILGEDQSMARQIHAINKGSTAARAFDEGHGNHNIRAQHALTQALVDLYAVMIEQNRHLLEMNQELQEHREHLEDLVRQRTLDLEAAHLSAETANRAKSTFIANLSHEIRTPMNAIVGLTWALHEASLDPAQKNKLKQVSDATQQLLGIINDLIDISRIESEKLSLEPLDFDLRQIVDHIVANHAGKARQKGLQFSTELTGELPPLLHGDPVRIAQIISNFVSNAIKFTPQGSVLLKIGLVAGDNPEQVILHGAVEDSGIGISAEQSSMIFQPFEQLEQSTRRRFGGTGLGLAISQRLADMMGGRVCFSSQPGQGSIFRFVIPLTVVCQSSQSCSAMPGTAANEALAIDWPVIEACLLGMTRLLAEDDIQCLSLWREHASLLKAVLGSQASRLEEELGQYNFETALVMTEELLS